MPVDKLGRMSDTKTKDTGVSLTYINNNYIRSGGISEITGNLNMASHTTENLENPTNPKDAVTKEYVDSGGVDSPFLKENDNYKATHTINMAYNKLVNLQKPIKPYDAVTKDYVDYIKKILDEQLKILDERLKILDKRKYVIAVHARYCGGLKVGEYQYNFIGGNFKTCEELVEKYKDFKGSTTGFLMPHSGRIKKFVAEDLSFFDFHEFMQEVNDEIVKIGLSDTEEVVIKLKEYEENVKEELKRENKEHIIIITPEYEIADYFKIVKFEKKLNEEDYPQLNTNPKIISSVLTNEVKVKGVHFRDIFKFGSIFKIR